ncbi:MAG: FAD-dependent oxidoreductase [Lentisphaerae bacterium]|nr:FAD-dependent oxidoreductase [Lentisphaerota bacterium]
MDTASRQDIAVVGGGVAGITAAWLLGRRHNVTLYEKNDRLGGHTHTVTVPEGPDAGTPVDTGFIVFNNKTYPCFNRFLEQLEVAAKPSDMSFSCTNETTGLQYAGTTLSGLFAQRGNLFRPAFWGLVAGILGFSRRTRRDLHAGALQGLSLGQYLERAGFRPDVVAEYVVPMASAIWSTPARRILDFPVESFARFYENHGLLSFRHRPVWFTVEGGSRRYVEAFQARFKGLVRTGVPVQRVRRDADRVCVALADGTADIADRVVMATHGDETLALLEDPSEMERRLLGAWTYSENRTILHTDPSFLPPNRRAWASWNYCRTAASGATEPATLTYHMNRLQRLDAERDYCVTLNPQRPVASGHVIADLVYRHPMYTAEALASQDGLRALNGKRRTFYCGSYLGYGFHEDAVRSAVDVGALFGIAL